MATGRKHMFYQDDPSLVQAICEDLNGQIFGRASLIIQSLREVTAFPGHSLVGITILTDPLPESLFERERASKTVITQVSEETFQYRKLQEVLRVEGKRGVIFSELEFTSGERLFLEIDGEAMSSMGERNAMHHLFTRPSISCRRLDGGFSIWNTAHIISWSQSPKLESPENAWTAESLAQPAAGDAKIVAML